MKKIFVICMLGLISFGFGATIDTANAIVKWTAFKTPAKAAVTGTFSDVQIKFGKPNKNGTIESWLDGATATIKPESINLNDDVKNANVRENFIAKFSKKDDIKVTLKEITEGKNQGTILATIKMNGKTNKVPMQYTIDKGKLIANGVIDLSEFNLESARASLQEFVKDLHEGITWSQVVVGFEVPVK